MCATLACIPNAVRVIQEHNWSSLLSVVDGTGSIWFFREPVTCPFAREATARMSSDPGFPSLQLIQSFSIPVGSFTIRPWIRTRQLCTAGKGDSSVFCTKKEGYLGVCQATQRVDSTGERLYNRKRRQTGVGTNVGPEGAPARTWGWVEIRGWGWVPAPARYCEIGRRLNRHRLVDSSKVWGWVDAQRVRHGTQYVRNTIEEVIS